MMGIPRDVFGLASFRPGRAAKLFFNDIEIARLRCAGRCASESPRASYLHILFATGDLYVRMGAVIRIIDRNLFSSDQLRCCFLVVSPHSALGRLLQTQAAMAELRAKSATRLLAQASAMMQKVSELKDCNIPALNVAAKWPDVLKLHLI
jgi:hypothetical protein